MAVNPHSPLDGLHVVLPELDMVLLMSVNPGFGGQKFIEAVVPKVSALRSEIDRRGLDIDIEVDGGIEPHTAPLVVAAGATILVAGSAVFHARGGDYRSAIAALRVAAGTGGSPRGRPRCCSSSGAAGERPRPRSGLWTPGPTFTAGQDLIVDRSQDQSRGDLSTSGTAYDLGADFSFSQNPNGPWRYGYTAGAALSVEAFQLDTVTVVRPPSVSGIPPTGRPGTTLTWPRIRRRP